MSNFLREAEAMSEQLIAWRRDFHEHPELGYQEIRTSNIVAEKLEELGIEVQRGVGKTGVVGVIDGAVDGPTVLLRFDMDALPIHETSNATYRSRTSGVMHACGHDGHVAIGLGAATLLNRERHSLRGRVKLVFQPAEEGLGGAMAMINDGVLTGPKPDISFGLHLWNQFETGRVIVQSGPLLAASDEFHLVIHGRGSHGALPHEGVDAIVAAAHAIAALQTIVSRNVDPRHTAVLTIGTIHGGQAFNIVADEVKITGTLRTFSEEVRQHVLQRAPEVVAGGCQAFGTTHEWDFSSYSAPATINAAGPTAVMREAAFAIAEENQVGAIEPMMIAEDMSEFLTRVPGCFALVGAGPYPHSHHNAGFDFDERALPIGVALLCEAAMRAAQNLK